MQDRENDENKSGIIGANRANRDSRLKTPHNIPAATCIQEAKDLYHWVQEDKEVLVASGLAWELVEDLPARSDALTRVEAHWQTQWLGRQKNSREWNTRSPLAYDLRNRLLAAFRHAFRNYPALLAPLRTGPRRKSHPRMIQDLNDLSVMGRANRQLLEAIGFDMSLLEKAAQTSTEMASLLAQTTTSRMEQGQNKKNRDQAYTYLKEAVDEIRRAGQYVFRRNKERYRGYISDHLRQKKIRRARDLKKKKMPQEKE